MALLGINFDVIDFYDIICITERHDQFKHSNCSKEPFLFVCFVALRPKSTAMVIAGRSVHLTTFFPGQA